MKWMKHIGIILCILAVVILCGNSLWVNAEDSDGKNTQLTSDVVTLETESCAETESLEEAKAPEETESLEETEASEEAASDAAPETVETAETAEEAESIEEEFPLEETISSNEIPETGTEEPEENSSAPAEAPVEEENVSAAVENEYVFWAENEEEARQICDAYGANLVSWESGIGVLRMAESVSTWRRSSVRLYPNYRYEIEAVSYDEEVNAQWHLALFDIGEVWKLSTGKGIKVAVIDSGVQTDHEALQANISLAETVIPDSAYGSDSYFTASYQGAQDNLGHGTHVAGIVGANAADGSLMGIAPECSLYSIKALERNGGSAVGYTSWIAKAILRAAELEVDIINLSVGGSQKEDEFMAEAISIAADSGCVVVCAAGNYNGSGQQSQIDFPAINENTIAVTAAKSSEETVLFDSSYSRYGSGVDFIAPGTSILSTYLNGRKYSRGTSMACPMVSGTYALLMEADPEAAADELTQLLRDTALDLGEEGLDEYHGYGLIQPLEALEVIEAEKEAEKEENENSSGNKKPVQNSGAQNSGAEEENASASDSSAADGSIVLPPTEAEVPETETAIPETETAIPEINAPVLANGNTESKSNAEQKDSSDAAESAPAESVSDNGLQNQQERIDALKEQLENISEEDEIQYEIQEEEKQPEELEKNCRWMWLIFLCLLGMGSLFFLILWKKRKEEEEEETASQESE